MRIVRKIMINKDKLIKEYIEGQINSFKVNDKEYSFKRADRVEKLLRCHGWLDEAEEAFVPYKKELSIKVNRVKSELYEILSNFKDNPLKENEDKLKDIEEDIIEVDSTGFIRLFVLEELLKLNKYKELGTRMKLELIMELGRLGYS